MSNNPKKTPREFTEVEGGQYDKFGFYRTPNGSFWDCDGVYFDRTGKDVHGGTYNKDVEYIPGEGWIDSLMCYEDEVELNQIQKNNDGDEMNDYEDGDYDVYEDINDDMNTGNYNGPSYYDVAGKGKGKGPLPKKISTDSGKEKTPVYSKITLKDDKPNPPKEQPQLDIKKKESKEVVQVDSITSSSFQEALKNKKDVMIDGFQISEGIDFSDDESDTKGGKKKKK
eukprot:CAMPEP_0170515650 /NCGR_PEP_ID=MMETSP0209-20121228/2059_1 /TAXON_ID=665100 ORGANISM="Litonotus pictus, Strain P1" /NCGR_SAMPLE_ID=MMETSP0209 /ASSEMBLY_ACC=CAM_ASM_000301 /LENGTH=225 /DNA_ID=CAMNT_0010800233 /DNA_START=1 /DNA_END=678 /DNA_ORIENTATION=-